MIPPLESCRSLLVLAMFAGAYLSNPRSAVSQSSDDAQTKMLAAALQLQESLAEVIDRVEPSVVAISRAPADGVRIRQTEPFPAQAPLELPFRQRDPFQPSGAGVVIDARGLILTQYVNVRAGDEHLVSTTGGRRLPAIIKAADPRSGLAVLEVNTTGLKSLQIGDADRLRKGHLVITLGNPKAIIENGEPSASWGTVTNLGQRASPTTNLNNTLDDGGVSYATTLHHLGTLLQTDATLNWAFGGGAVVDLSGQLIGITTTAGTLPGHESAAGYAIPMTSVFRRIVDDLKAGREVEYGLLGLRLDGPEQIPSNGERPDGAVVSLTVAGGPAERAGIRAGDRLVEVDGKSVRTVSDLQLLVGGLPPGLPVTVGLIRGGKRLDLEVSLSKLHVQGEQVYTAAKRTWRGMEVDYSTALPLAEIERAAELSRIDPAGCVVVASVQPGSPAELAGIEAGMFVSHVGDQRVSTPDEFFAAVEDVEETVNLRFTDATAPENGKPNLTEREVLDSDQPQ